MFFSCVSFPFPLPFVPVSFGNFDVSPFASHGTFKQIPSEAFSSELFVETSVAVFNPESQ